MLSRVTRLPLHATHAQIGLNHAFIRRKLGGVPLKGNAPSFNDICVVRNLQSGSRVLLNQQDRHTCIAQFGHRVKHLLNDQGRQPQAEVLQSSELALRAELNRSATSKAVTAMVKKGLVERRVLPGNRRITQLQLSEAGQRLYEEILPLVEEVNRELMAQLAPQEIESLDSMMERMQQQADEMALRLSQMPRANRRRGGSRRVDWTPDPPTQLARESAKQR